MTSLHLDWCDIKAATFACDNWCPREGMVKGASNRIGVWEDGDFRACLVFTRPPVPTAKRLGLERSEVSELARFARWHLTAPFSQFFPEALKIFREHNPEVRMLVGIVQEPHVGTILQAASWICLGRYFPGAGARLTYALPLDRNARLLLDGLTVPYSRKEETTQRVG